MSRIIAAMLVSLGLAWGMGAWAQTRCPMGAQTDNIQCMPDAAPVSGGPSVPQTAGHWIKTWGAIASANSTQEVGTTVGKFSQDEARNSAIETCAQKGAKDCKVEMVYHDQCATIVSGNTGTFFQASASKELATRRAFESCEQDGGGCKFIYSDCTEPAFAEY